MILKMSCLYQILKVNTALSLKSDVIGMKEIKSYTQRCIDDRLLYQLHVQLHFEVGELSVHHKKKISWSLRRKILQMISEITSYI